MAERFRNGPANNGRGGTVPPRPFLLPNLRTHFHPGETGGCGTKFSVEAIPPDVCGRSDE